jgi:sigma-B regulation protein RsbQ
MGKMMFKTQTMPMRQKLNARVLGDGEQVLVLAHGFGCDQRIWQRLLPQLSLLPLKLVLFDYAGCGDSQVTDADITAYPDLQAYADDLLQLLEELQLSEVILLAHSISCAIGMLASIREPQRFKKILAITPSARYQNATDYYGGFNAADIEQLLQLMELNQSGWAGILAPKVLAEPEASVLSEQLTQSFLRNNPAFSRHFARLVFYADIRAVLPQVSIPVIIFYTLTDMIVPEQAIDYLVANLPQAKAVLLNARGHYPQLCQPQQLAEQIKRELVYGVV